MGLLPSEAAPSFDHYGYQVLKGFLNKGENTRIRALVESTLRAPHEMACARPNNTLVPLRWNDSIVTSLLESERRIRLLRETVAADDLRWISGYISIKEPQSRALWWHSDWWCWDHPISFQPQAAQVAVLTYLDSTRMENGALRVLPGSHHKSAQVHAILPEAHSKSAEALDPEHEAMRDLPGEVTLDLESGDAVVIDYRLLHGTHPNSSSARRDCVLLSFTPSWQRLPEEFKSHLIQHPALPSEIESPVVASHVSELLPSFRGARRSLDLNRNAPAHFGTAD